ncbi:hypothetical protein E2F47_07000 [Mycobacterium eburneum]|nr:hypothetical protein E2F47_07000 [Mycobacterium eburneum]
MKPHSRRNFLLAGVRRPAARPGRRWRCGHRRRRGRPSPRRGRPPRRRPRRWSARSAAGRWCRRRWR